MPKRDKPEEKRFEARGIYGAHSKEPMVDIMLGREHIQVTPMKARQLGSMLIESAEAAEGDAFLVGFFRDYVQLEPAQYAQLLVRFRAERNRRYGRDKDRLEPVEPI